MRTTRRGFLARAAAATAGLVVQQERLIRAGEATRQPVVKQLPTVERIRATDPNNWKLVDAINEHRVQHNLPAISLSPRLTAVAHFHARDLAERQPQKTFGSLHSWSLDDRWRGGAYRPDDKNTWTIMWDKPKEIAGYAAFGFEICAADAQDRERAFELWLKSDKHHAVILNRDVWADKRWQWQALGAVFYKGFACAWFGNLADA